MLDTLQLWLPAEEVGRSNLPTYVPDFLERPTRHQRANGEEWVSGNLNNLIVSVGKAGLSVKGSFNTYYHRNNMGNLTRQDCEFVVTQLSDVLHLPMNRANVGRVDVGKTMLTMYPPAAYFGRLGTCQHYARLTQPESLRYQNSKRQLVFYDKIAESKHAQLPIPDAWANRNALRYEGRFTSRLPKQFNQATVKAADLYNETFYMGLIDLWVKEFEHIQKVKQADIQLEQAMMSRKDFSEIAERLLVQQLGGEVAALELIEQNRLMGVYKSRTEVKRLKDRIRELGQPAGAEVIPTADLMVELHRKIKQSQQYYR